jgi:hypothetical protein
MNQLYFDTCPSIKYDWITNLPRNKFFIENQNAFILFYCTETTICRGKPQTRHPRHLPQSPATTNPRSPAMMLSVSVFRTVPFSSSDRETLIALPAKMKKKKKKKTKLVVIQKKASESQCRNDKFI